MLWINAFLHVEYITSCTNAHMDTSIHLTYDHFVLKGGLKMIYFFLEVDREVNWYCAYDHGTSWVWEYFKDLTTVLIITVCL